MGGIQILILLIKESKLLNYKAFDRSYILLIPWCLVLKKKKDSMNHDIQYFVIFIYIYIYIYRERERERERERDMKGKLVDL